MSQVTKSHSGTDGNPTESAASAVGHLYEAKERLKDAAGAAGEAVDVKAAAGAEVDRIKEKSRDLWDSAEGVIREHPVAAFGAAFAVGWLIARVGRRH